MFVDISYPHFLVYKGKVKLKMNCSIRATTNGWNPFKGKGQHACTHTHTIDRKRNTNQNKSFPIFCLLSE